MWGAALKVWKEGCGFEKCGEPVREKILDFWVKILLADGTKKFDARGKISRFTNREIVLDSNKYFCDYFPFSDRMVLAGYSGTEQV